MALHTSREALRLTVDETLPPPYARRRHIFAPAWIHQISRWNEVKTRDNPPSHSKLSQTAASVWSACFLCQSEATANLPPIIYALQISQLARSPARAPAKTRYNPLIADPEA